jgi:polysaccharide biosynthesis protein PslG
MDVIVRRYRDRIHSWELWNEPDNAAYWLGTAAQFAALVRAGSAAVRAADPRARVVLGGIAGELDFLGKLFRDEHIAPAIDVVNIHSYFETWHPNAIEQLPDYIDGATAIVHESGSPAPLWMAETGYSTVGDHAEISSVYHTHYRGEHSEGAQAAALTRTIFTVLGTGRVSLIAWYRINDLPTAENVIGDDNNRHLGVRRLDGAPKPALAAWLNFRGGSRMNTSCFRRRSRWPRGRETRCRRSAAFGCAMDANSSWRGLECRTRRRCPRHPQRIRALRR